MLMPYGNPLYTELQLLAEEDRATYFQEQRCEKFRD